MNFIQMIGSGVALTSILLSKRLRQGCHLHFILKLFKQSGGHASFKKNLTLLELGTISYQLRRSVITTRLV